MDLGGQPRSVGLQRPSLDHYTSTTSASSSHVLVFRLRTTSNSLGPSHSSSLALLEHSAWSPLTSTPLPTPWPGSFLRLRLCHLMRTGRPHPSYPKSRLCGVSFSESLTAPGKIFFTFFLRWNIHREKCTNHTHTVNELAQTECVHVTRTQIMK